MSTERLADAELAAVVTYLEMREPPADPAVPSSSLRLERRDGIAPAAYRDLFRKVGAPWMWFSRLVDSDRELTALLHGGAVELFAVVDATGTEVGMLELDFRTTAACELSFLGLVPELAGKGHGKWLLAEALARAWRPGVTRVHVHTCSLDHPAALSAYRRAGFIPYARGVERFADPRTAGILPPDTAPQVPLLGTLVSAARWA